MQYEMLHRKEVVLQVMAYGHLLVQNGPEFQKKIAHGWEIFFMKAMNCSARDHKWEP